MQMQLPSRLRRLHWTPQAEINVAMPPFFLGLFILFWKSAGIPNVSATMIVFISNLILFGYTGFLFTKKLVWLRLGTVSLAFMGLARSYGSFREELYRPLGVWLIVFSMCILAHFHLRREMAR